MRLIGAAFFALAVYILIQLAVILLGSARPQPSPLGIAWLASTLVAMLLRSWGKRVTGLQLCDPVLHKECLRRLWRAKAQDVDGGDGGGIGLAHHLLIFESTGGRSLG
jgi:hypothetical protein